MLEELIKQKRKECIEKVKKEVPEIEKNKPENWHCHPIFAYTKIKEIPTVFTEFLIWDYFSTDCYWRAFSHLKAIVKKEDNPITEESLEQITNIMVNQLMEGKIIASNVPLYSDVWNLLCEEENPIAKYITDEHKKTAVNIGFWSSLNNILNSENVRDASRELSRIMSYKDFFDYFDFKEGVNKSKELPCLDIEKYVSSVHLNDFTNWDLYTLWYGVQEIGIYRESKREKADEIVSKLIAPLVYYLIRTNFNRSLEEEARLRSLSNYLIQGDIIATKTIQDTLGIIFEDELEDILEDIEYCSSDGFKVCERNLQDPDKHAKKVWEKVKDNVNLSSIPAGIEKYIPKDVFESDVSGLKEKIAEMKRFDIKLYNQWGMSHIRKNTAKSMHTRVRNKALEIYFNQTRRPSREDVLNLYHHRNDSYRLKGFLLSDLLSKEEWKHANDLLLDYDKRTGKQQQEFHKAIIDYVNMHGKIQVKEYGTSVKVCYPEYNRIREIVENKKLFEIKK